MTFADDIVPGSLIELNGTHCILNNEDSLQYVINAMTNTCVYIHTEKRYVAVVVARGMLPFAHGNEVFKFDCEALVVQVLNCVQLFDSSKSPFVRAFFRQHMLNPSDLYVVYAHEWFPSVTLVS